jgi:hypothetical protein
MMAFLGWLVEGEWQTEPPKEWMDKLEQAFIEAFGLKKKENQEVIENKKTIAG